MDPRHDQTARLIENERAQIGHEIHDGLLPLIFAASAGLGALIDDLATGGEEETPRLQRARQVAGWLDEAMQSGRRILTGVYPPELSDGSWTHAATACVERLLGDKASCVQWNIDPAVNELDAGDALAAYRIVIEAIRNAISHGGATQVDVIAAKSEAGDWVISITDNGSGFEPSEIPKDRFGCRAMAGRAELVGGTFDLESRPGGPTKVTLTLIPVSGTL